MSQKGFSTIFVFATLAMLSVIVGIIVFSKDTYKSTLHAQKIKNYAQLSNQEAADLRGRILLVAKDGKLLVSSPDGNRTEAFNINLDNELEISSGSIYPISVSPDRTKLLLTGFTKDHQLVNVIASLVDRSFEIVRSQQAKAFSDYILWTWSADSKNLVYSTRNAPQELPGTVKRTIGIYNVATKETKELYSEEEYKTEFFPGPLRIIAYDQARHVVTFTDDNAPTLKDATSGKPIGLILDLQTKRKNAFEEPNMYTSVAGEVEGTYFIRSNNEIDPYSRDDLKIFASSEPLMPIGEIKLNKNQFFNDFIIWSSDYQYFSVQTIERYNASKNEVRIYSRDGNLVRSYPSPNTSYSNAIFSSDNKKAVIFDGDGAAGWKVIDIKTGELNAKNSNPLGRPVYIFE